MTHQDAEILINEIENAYNFKPYIVEVSIITTAKRLIAQGKPLSSSMSKVLQDIYRRSQGHYKQKYSKIETLGGNHA